MGHTRTAHFSVSDTIWLFKGLKEEGYASAFEQPVLAYFRELHEQHGITVSFYCFAEHEDMRLADVPDAYSQEFSENGDWLRFGFHAKNENTHYEDKTPECAARDYAEVTAQLRRIVGTAIDAYPRIHSYSASQAALNAMREEGLRGVLCPESDDGGYCLSEKQLRRVKSKGVYVDKNGLVYLDADMKIEETNCILSILQKRQHKPHLEIFTHEWALDRERVRERLLICGSLLHRLGYQGGFWNGEGAY